MREGDASTDWSSFVVARSRRRRERWRERERWGEREEREQKNRKRNRSKNNKRILFYSRQHNTKDTHTHTRTYTHTAPARRHGIARILGPPQIEIERDETRRGKNENFFLPFPFFIFADSPPPICAREKSAPPALTPKRS